MCSDSLSMTHLFFFSPFLFFLFKMYLLQVEKKKRKGQVSAAAVPKKKVTRSELKVLSLRLNPTLLPEGHQVVKEQGCPSYEGFHGWDSPQARRVAGGLANEAAGKIGPAAAIQHCCSTCPSPVDPPKRFRAGPMDLDCVWPVSRGLPARGWAHSGLLQV